MKKEYRFILLLAAIKFILPFILQSSYYEPQRDEFLYFAESHHMAWGFMEVPPLLSLLTWLSKGFGHPLFWIKFWPSLFGSLTYLVVAQMILSFNGKKLALTLAFLPFIFGAYLRMHFLFQPNFLEIFFWTMLCYSFLRFIQTQQNKWLYIFGISAGLGMLSKYSVAFVIVSIVLGALITRSRKVFANKHFYIGAVIGFLIFLPNLIWQYVHHFPVLFHMKELRESQLQYVSPAGFLSDQVLMFLPCIFIWIAGIYFAITKENGRYRIFAWTYLFVIVLLIYLQGKSYYAVGIYPVLFALGAVHLERFAFSHKRFWRYAFVIIPFVLGIPLVPLLLPVARPAKLANYYKVMHIDKTGLTKWEDQKIHPLPQDFADMLGWKEMAEKTAKAYSTLTDEEKKQTFLFADNYGEAGAINFYGKDLNLPEIHSANASYLYWLPDSIHIVNLLLVTDDIHEMSHDFVKDFHSARVMDSITNPFAREHGSLIIIFKGANEKFNRMMQQKLTSERAKIDKH